MVGIFKGIIEVENKDDKEKYLVKKDQLLEELKDLVNKLSLKVVRKPFLMDPSKLASAVERDKFEQYVRQLGIDHLQI